MLGVLPRPGGLNEQPYWIYQAIEHCERTYRKLAADGGDGTNRD